MSRKWWESDRSRLAASVRATRRRLRAGYRASLAKAVAEERARADAGAATQVRAAIEQAERSEARADAVVALLHRHVLHTQDHHLTRRLIAEISVDERVLLEGKNLRSIGGEIARRIAASVERTVAEAIQ